eukprot:SM000087S23329  [mRNA]  locus=s87:39667:41183:+ [translate_table: standard]
MDSDGGGGGGGGEKTQAASLAHQALADISAVFLRAGAGQHADPAQLLVDEVLEHRDGAIFFHGVGREGLMMRAFAMRMAHLGLRVHVVGDMSTPAIGKGDLFLASAGPGGFSTVNALLGVAGGAGARTVVITARPEGSASALADSIAVLPAQTMADTQVSPAMEPPVEQLSVRREPRTLGDVGDATPPVTVGSAAIAANCLPQLQSDQAATSAPEVGRPEEAAVVEAAEDERSLHHALGIEQAAPTEGSASQGHRFYEAASMESIVANMETSHIPSSVDELNGDVAASSDSRLAAAEEEEELLPMGSIFEGALFVLAEIVVLLLRRALNISTDEMLVRHTNME